MPWSSNRLISCLLLLNISVHVVNASVFDYIFPKKSGANTDLESLPSIPYVLSERDEKFLEDARIATSSELDRCHHRVIMTLQSKCNNMNAEELGKLSVMLLNCQSYTEGRGQYSCNDNMSLKECTSGMNDETWNAYHIMTNRAKAICISVLQDQFRGLTELTVNKLMSTAHEQLKISKELFQNQNELQELSVDAFNEIFAKNTQVMSQQSELLQMTDAHRAKVESNLREITRERGLIRSGQMEVFSFLQNIKNKIDENFNQLDLHSKRSRLNHDEIVTDVEQLREHIIGILQQMEEMSNHLIAQNKFSLDQQDSTIVNLEKMNSTVLGLTNVINNMLLNFEQKIKWMHGHEFLERHFSLIAVHLIFLILGMIVLSFLFADLHTRLVFVITTIADFAAVIFELYKFDALIFSTTLMSMLLGNLLIKALIKYFKNRPQKMVTPKNRKIEVNNVNNTENILRGRTNSQDSESSEPSTSSENPQKDFERDTATPERSSTPFITNSYARSMPRSMTPDIERVLRTEGIISRAGTPFSSTLANRVQCISITKKGAQCLNAAVVNKKHCRTHDKIYIRE